MVPIVRWVTLAIVAVAAAILVPSGASASVLVVNSATDPGDGTCDATECTLREAIVASNATVGVRETITFAIGSGPVTIPIGPPAVNGLPAIFDPVTIDGTTQPGYAGTPLIELDGTDTNGASGLILYGGDNEVRGLIFVHFEDYAISINSNGPGPGGNTVAGNYFGIHHDGVTPQDPGGPNFFGDIAPILIVDSPNNTIGGDTAADRNVISGSVEIRGLSANNSVIGNYIGVDINGDEPSVKVSKLWVTDSASGNHVGLSGQGNVIEEIEIQSDGNFVQGNLIGVKPDGETPLGASGPGMMIRGDGNVVGGASPGDGNVIGGFQTGVELQGSDNVMLGNYIGSSTGGSPIGNFQNGILVTSAGNVIGGAGPGEGNVIAFNGDGDDTGVKILGVTATSNTIRGNSIYANQPGGISLTNGGNQELAKPSITSEGPLSGTACANCIVDVYTDDANQGERYEGSTVANGSGNWSFAGVYQGPNVTATATDAAGNTSVFSTPFACADVNADTTCDVGDDEDGDLLTDALEIGCGSDPFSASSTPERVDGAFGGTDEDGDSQVDEALPGGSGVFDCDRDGYIGSTEAYVFGGAPDRDQDPCGTGGWPSDLVSGGIPNSTNKVNILDLASFVTPVRYLGTDVGTNPGDERWDLSPGPGPLGTDINILDIAAMTAPGSATGAPPMLGGVRAFLGPDCPWAP